MLKRAIDFVNANPAILAGVMCLIGALFVIVYAIDGRNRRRLKQKIRNLRAAVEQRDAEIIQMRSEIKRLKSDLFAADMNKKISEEKLSGRIRQLELDKKQMMKWGSEK